MIRPIPATAMYGLFALGALLATHPVWSLWLFGFRPSLDDLLRVSCFGL
jgi:hypothetical protein